MTAPQRWTRATEDLARWVIEQYTRDPDAEFFGLEAAKATGYGPGTVYPVIRRMEDAGWLLSREEESDGPRSVARPARIYYRINPATLPAVRQRLAELDARRRDLAGSGTTAPAHAAGRRTLWGNQ